MRLFFRAVALAGLIGLGPVGCRPVANTAANASTFDFPEGAAVYAKKDRAFAGKVIKYEAAHTFPDGEKGEAVLMRGTDGQEGWYRVEVLRRSFTTR